MSLPKKHLISGIIAIISAAILYMFSAILLIIKEGRGDFAILIFLSIPSLFVGFIIYWICILVIKLVQSIKERDVKKAVWTGILLLVICVVVFFLFPLIMAAFTPVRVFV